MSSPCERSAQIFFLLCTESISLCPNCDKEAGQNTICCEECDSWYHYDCLGLTPAEINKIDTDIPYICDNCNDNLIYAQETHECSSKTDDKVNKDVNEPLIQNETLKSPLGTCSENNKHSKGISETVIISDLEESICKQDETGGEPSSSGGNITTMNTRNEKLSEIFSPESVLPASKPSQKHYLTQTKIDASKVSQSDADSENAHIPPNINNTVYCNPHRASKRTESTKVTEKSSASQVARGKKSQAREQQQINLEQEQYIHKLERKIKELEQAVSLSRRREETNDLSGQSSQNSQAVNGQLPLGTSHSNVGQAASNNYNHHQLDSLEARMKQMEVNMFQNLFLMTMNNSQIGVQLQNHAQAVQNIQLQQMSNVNNAGSGLAHRNLYCGCTQGQGTRPQQVLQNNVYENGNCMWSKPQTIHSTAARWSHDGVQVPTYPPYPPEPRGGPYMPYPTTSISHPASQFPFSRPPPRFMESSQQPEFQQNMYGQLPGAVNQPVLPAYVPHIPRVSHGFLASPQPHLIAPVSQVVPNPQPMIRGLTPSQMAHSVPFPIAGPQAAPQNVETLPSNHVTGLIAQQYMPVGDGPSFKANSHRLPVSDVAHSVPVYGAGSQAVLQNGKTALSDQTIDLTTQQSMPAGEGPLAMAKSHVFPTVPYSKPVSMGQIPVSQKAHGVPIPNDGSRSRSQNRQKVHSDQFSVQQCMSVGEGPSVKTNSYRSPMFPNSRGAHSVPVQEDNSFPNSQGAHGVPVQEDNSRLTSQLTGTPQGTHEIHVSCSSTPVTQSDKIFYGHIPELHLPQAVPKQPQSCDHEKNNPERQASFLAIPSLSKEPPDPLNAEETLFTAVRL